MKWGNKTKAKEEKVWFNKGFNLYSIGRFDEAILFFDRALKRNPQMYDAWYYKGSSLASLGRFDEAIVCFDKASEINPQYVVAQNKNTFADWEHKTAKEKASNLGDSADPYEILSVPRDAPCNQVKDAWRELIKKYHPDMAKDKDTTTQELYGNEFDKINKAWEEIKKAKGWH